MCEMLPEDAVVYMIQVPKNAVPSTTKYNVTEVQPKKVIPIKILQNGKFMHKCPMCEKVMVSWVGGIDTLIRIRHILACTAKKCVNLWMVCAIISEPVKQILLR